MEFPEHETTASDIMEMFARKTGPSASGNRPKRYLWTDAFAVSNFLQLYHQTGEQKYLQLALDLVDQVHQTLGKHREDDQRSGWISGLGESDGHLHPTIGGLRIGKELGERSSSHPYDERSEWDHDGQYYHYLTKWIHALHQVSSVTEDTIFSQWACELAKTIHKAFVHQERPEEPKRLYWKMSIDLTYPLVSSMGRHDPLDGLVTYHEVRRLYVGASKCDLDDEIADLSKICSGSIWTTGDPLGIGGLLFDACRILQMIADETYAEDQTLLLKVLQSSIAGLQHFVAQSTLEHQPEKRLPFRELGLAIGLHGVPMMLALLENTPGLGSRNILRDILNNLMPAVSVAKSIEGFWLSATNRRYESWRAHEDINMVMLATSLAPEGFLNLKAMKLK